MRLSAKIGVWLLALLGAANASAIPLNYSVSYDGSVVGGAGTGSFSFDDVTSLVTNFNFTFGNITGSLPDQLLNGPQVFGGSFGGFVFEVLTGLDTHPRACGSALNCGVTLAPLPGLVRFTTFNRVVGNPLATYQFRDSAATLVFAGGLSVQQVPEPAGLALLGLGVLGLGLMRRKSARRQG